MTPIPMPAAKILESRDILAYPLFRLGEPSVGRRFALTPAAFGVPDGDEHYKRVERIVEIFRSS